MAPTAWDKAFYEKNFLSYCKAFQKAATASPPAQQPSRRPHRHQPKTLPGLDELHKVLGLLKALLAEPHRVIAKVLTLCVREHLLGAVVAWLDRSVSIVSVDIAAGLAGTQASPLPHQTSIHQAFLCTQRLIRMLHAMLQPYRSPEDLHAPDAEAAAAFAASTIDMQTIDRVFAGVLHPVVQSTATGKEVHTQYSYAVLGAALNTSTALAALATHPAMAGSTLSACVLEAACMTELLPSVTGLLAHAKAAPAAGQGQEAWYETSALTIARLIAAARDGPATVSQTFMLGWQRALVSPMVQEFLLERLIHGLRDASQTGLECPPGFEDFALLPGRCSPNDTELLPCLQLSLEAVWLAWRAQQARGGPDAYWAPGEQPPLEGAQLFELTRQVAEQAMAVVADDMAVQDDIPAVTDGDANNAQAGQLCVRAPKSVTVSALAAAATCLSDLQHLWPTLQLPQKQTQLKLVLALAANTLAFATQGLEAVQGLTCGEAAGQVVIQPIKAYHDGLDADQAAWENQHASASLRDAFGRAVDCLAFFFPVNKEGAQLVGPLPMLYNPQSWSDMATQADGVLGAVEMALRAGFAAAGTAEHVTLLHAVAGAMQAAPGSYWTHMGGDERTGLLSTLRKLANQAATALESNVAAALHTERQMLAAPTEASTPNRHLSASQLSSLHSSQAVRAAQAAADFIDVSLQQQVDFLYRLLMLIVDGNTLMTAPVPVDPGAPPSNDPDFTGISEDNHRPSASWSGQSASHSTSQQQRTQPPSPSVALSVPLTHTSSTQSQPAALTASTASLAATLGRKGRGTANPQGPVTDAAPLRRVSAAQLQLRAWLLAELLPPWLRLWSAQVSALLVAVRAEAYTSARTGTTTSPSRVSGATNTGTTKESETARYALMRAGMAWLNSHINDSATICSAVFAARSGQHTQSDSTLNRAQQDQSLTAVTRAARLLVSTMLASDPLAHVQGMVQQEIKRLADLGVPEGQAGLLNTVAQLLSALLGLPGKGRAVVARVCLEQGVAGALGGLFDEQRRLGGRIAAATATMDALQTVAEAVEDILKVSGATKATEAAVQVVEVRRMLSQLHSVPPPTTPLPPATDAYADESFEAQATALVDVIRDEACESIRRAAGPLPALDGVLAGMHLHVGCCYVRCSNLEQEGEHLLPLHVCQGCMRVRYCSRACQVAAWPSHQEQCKQWAKAAQTMQHPASS